MQANPSEKKSSQACSGGVLSTASLSRKIIPDHVAGDNFLAKNRGSQGEVNSLKFPLYEGPTKPRSRRKNSLKTPSASWHLKIGKQPQKETNIVFQSSIFRFELLVSGRLYFKPYDGVWRYGTYHLEDHPRTGPHPCVFPFAFSPACVFFSKARNDIHISRKSQTIIEVECTLLRGGG